MTGPSAPPSGPGGRAQRVGAGRDAYAAGRDQYFDQHREIHLSEWAAGEPGMVSVEPLLGRLPQQVQGRDELVGLLAGLVVGSSRCRVRVLHGMGGCGKTTVALAVARNVGSRGVRVWQVDASNAARLSAGMRQIASDLAAGDRQFETWIQRAWSGQGSGPDLLWRLLNAADDPWLLVVDQADEPQLLAAEGTRLADGTGWLRPFDGVHGLVLVTSRDGNSGSWGPWAGLHQITPLRDDDAADLLVDLAGPNAGPRSDALRLAARLGSLPLALNLAGQDLKGALDQPFFPGEKVISSFAAYYDDLHERAARMNDSAADDATPAQRMLQTVTLTVTMSLDQIDRLGIKVARPLLILLSCYADAPIPTTLLLDPASLATSPLFAGLVPGQLRQALTALTGRNLINSYRPPDAGDDPLAHVVRLHPLIQDSNRGRLDSPEQGQAYLRLLVDLLDHALVEPATSKDVDPLEPASWPRWRSLGPHCTALLRLSDTFADDTNQGCVARAVHLTVEYGRHLDATGLPDQAETILHLCLNTATALLGEHHPDTLFTRHALAGVLEQRGQLDAAEAEYRAVHQARRDLLGEHHPDTLDSRDVLVWIRRRLGKKYPDANSDT